MEMRNMLGLSGMLLDNQEGFYSLFNNGNIKVKAKNDNQEQKSASNAADVVTAVVVSVVWFFLAILPAIVVYIYVPHNKVLNTIATLLLGLVWIVVLAVYYVVLPRVNEAKKSSKK